MCSSLESSSLDNDLKLNPEARNAGKALAREVITFLHGEEEYEKALKVSESLFNGNIKELKKSEILIGFKGVTTFKVVESNIVDLLVNNNICSSKREAREFVSAGAISINNKKVIDLDYVLSVDDTIDGKVLIIKRGKKNYYLGMIRN